MSSSHLVREVFVSREYAILISSATTVIRMHYVNYLCRFLSLTNSVDSRMLDPTEEL